MNSRYPLIECESGKSIVMLRIIEAFTRGGEGKYHFLYSKNNINNKYIKRTIYKELPRPPPP